MRRELITGTERDEERIDAGSEDALAYWSQHWGVPVEELRRAIGQVGPRVKDVRQHLVGGFTTAGPTS